MPTRHPDFCDAGTERASYSVEVMRGSHSAATSGAWRSAGTAACPAVEPLHNRMPLLIEYDSCDLWLHSDPATASSLLSPYSDDLILTPANPKMNSGATEGPECLQSPLKGLF
jgi:putative SOS response-associated peptidase YedK